MGTTELTPRVKLTASPYATNAGTVDGKHASDLLDKATYDADGNGIVDVAAVARGVDFSHGVNLQLNDGRVMAGDGSLQEPGYAFTRDLTSGVYRPAAGSLGFSTNGFEALRLDGSGVSLGLGGVAAVPGLRWSGDAGTGLYHPGIGWLGFATDGIARLVVAGDGPKTVLDSPSYGLSLRVAMDEKLLLAADGTVSLSGGIHTFLPISPANPNGKLTTGDIQAHSVDVAAGIHAGGELSAGGVSAGMVAVGRPGDALGPTLYWSNELGGGSADTDTGLYHPADGEIHFCTNGSDRFVLNPFGSELQGNLTLRGGLVLDDGAGNTSYADGRGLTTPRNGKISAGTVNVFTSGTIGAPSLHWNEDSGTGLYHPADGQIGFGIGAEPCFVMGRGDQPSATRCSILDAPADQGFELRSGGMQRFWYRPGYLFGARNTLFDMYFFSSTLVYKPGGGSFGDSSDLRLKKDVVSLTGALDQLLSLRGVSFQWIDPEKHGGLTGPQMGFIAQEVEGVFPQWVTTAPDGYKSVGLPMGFSALTVEAIRDLATEVQVQRADSQAQNETLKAKNAALEADLVGTKAELAATKATLADLLQRVQALEAKK